MSPDKSVFISVPVWVLCKASWLNHVMLTLFSVVWSEICKRMLCIYLFTPKLKCSSYCNGLLSVNDAFLKGGGRGGGTQQSISYKVHIDFFSAFLFSWPLWGLTNTVSHRKNGGMRIITSYCIFTELLDKGRSTNGFIFYTESNGLVPARIYLLVETEITFPASKPYGKRWLESQSPNSIFSLSCL